MSRTSSTKRRPGGVPGSDKIRLSNSSSAAEYSRSLEMATRTPASTSRLHLVQLVTVKRGPPTRKRTVGKMRDLIAQHRPCVRISVMKEVKMKRHARQRARQRHTAEQADDRHGREQSHYERECGGPREKLEEPQDPAG